MKHKTQIALLASALTAAALAAPAAQARPIDTPGVGVNSSYTAGATPGVHQSSAQTTSAGSGFDWGDAGIGGVATLSILGLGVAGSGVARRSRSVRPSVS
jgi:hypothetical protein